MRRIYLTNKEMLQLFKSGRVKTYDLHGEFIELKTDEVVPEEAIVVIGLELQKTQNMIIGMQKALKLRADRIRSLRWDK